MQKPSTNFYSMFLPCQSGKTRQMIRAIRIAYQQNTNRPSIPFIITTNHSQLTLQTASRLHQSLYTKYKLFVLNSSHPYHPNQLFYKERVVYNPQIDVVMNYLERFHTKPDSLLPPMFISLSNTNQLKKVFSFIDYFNDSISYPVDVYFDEADITYLTFRDDWIPYLYRTNSITLITATPQRLLQSDIDEIPLFQPYPVKHTKEFETLYMNHLDNELVEYCTTPALIIEPNSFILDVLRTNFRHFSAPLPNGKFRKIIAISTMFIRDHTEMATIIRSEFAFNVLTINASGINLYMVGDEDKKTYTSVKTEFSKFLHHIETNNQQLQQAPLVIIGNRRIDRGVTFQLPEEDMLIRDLIIPPHIKQIPRMIQILGRIAGYIKHRLSTDDKVRIYTKPLKSIHPTTTE